MQSHNFICKVFGSVQLVFILFMNVLKTLITILSLMYAFQKVISFHYNVTIIKVCMSY